VGQGLQTAGGEVNHGLHLLAVKPVEPAQNLVKADARLEVFENRGHRHARATLFVAAGFSRAACHWSLVTALASPRSLQEWEQGRRRPESAVRAYLTVFDRNPEAVEETLMDKP